MVFYVLEIGLTSDGDGLSANCRVGEVGVTLGTSYPLVDMLKIMN